MNKIKESVPRISAHIQFNSIRQKMMAGFSVAILFTVIVSGMAIGNSIQSSERTEEAAFVNEQLLAAAREDDNHDVFLL